MCECKMDLRARFKTNGPQLDVGEKENIYSGGREIEIELRSCGAAHWKKYGG